MLTKGKYDKIYNVLVFNCADEDLKEQKHEVDTKIGNKMRMNGEKKKKLPLLIIKTRLHS